MMTITKGMAKRMYDNGKEIMILPDRLKTTSPMATWVRKAEGVSFEKLCEVVFFYNCNPKAGTKLAFYAKEV